MGVDDSSQLLELPPTRSLAQWAASLDAAVDDAAYKTRRAIQALAPLRAYEYTNDGEAASEPEDSTTRAVAMAFGYHVEQHQTGRQRRVLLAPYHLASGGEQYPPPIEAVPSEVVDVWVALSKLVSAPYVAAHLAHLLFERRYGNARQWALRASDAYRAAAQQATRVMDAIDSVSTALRLARAIGDENRSCQAQQTMIDLARSQMATPETNAGPVLRVFEILVDERPVLGSDLDDLLVAAHGRYPATWAIDRLLALQRNRAQSDGRRRELDEARFELWLREAAGAEGFMRGNHLQTAIRRAQKAHRPDLIAVAIAQLQEMNPDELGFQRISASVHTGREEIEQLIAPVAEAPSWQEALEQFAAFGPLSGLVDDNRATVAEHARIFPLSQLMPPHLYRDGLPRLEPATDEERAEYHLSQQEGQRIAAMGPFAAMALRRIVDRHGLPTEAALVEYLAAQPLVDTGLAGALARSLLRYWVGDYEGAAFTAAPRIERLVRNLVLTLNEPIYRLQAGQTPGKFPGLGTLLPILRDQQMNLSWWRFIYTLCVNPAGFNLRSDIAHGAINSLSDWPAALLLQAALHLTWYAPIATQSDAVESSRDENS